MSGQYPLSLLFTLAALEMELRSQLLEGLLQEQS
jgi:hypothetical protein